MLVYITPSKIAKIDDYEIIAETNGKGYIIRMTSDIDYSNRNRIYVYKFLNRNSIYEYYGFKNYSDLLNFSNLLKLKNVGVKTARKIITHINKFNDKNFLIKNLEKIELSEKMKREVINYYKSKDGNLDSDKRKTEVTNKLVKMGFSKDEINSATKNYIFESQTTDTIIKELIKIIGQKKFNNELHSK